MADGVVRFRRKPERTDSEDQMAAQYTPGSPLDFLDLLKVAQEADSEAVMAIADLPTGPVLVVRYRAIYDDHPSKIEYVVIEPGQWLAYSGGNGFLYETDDANWAQFYDRAAEDQSP